MACTPLGSLRHQGQMPEGTAGGGRVRTSICAAGCLGGGRPYLVPFHTTCPFAPVGPVLPVPDLCEVGGHGRSLSGGALSPWGFEDRRREKPHKRDDQSTRVDWVAKNFSQVTKPSNWHSCVVPCSANTFIYFFRLAPLAPFKDVTRETNIYCVITICQVLC